MKYFRVDAPAAARSLTIYPIVCVHAGAEQHDEKFFDDTIRRIKDDPTARWLYMGDGGECVTKLSKGDVYNQTMSPTQQQQYLAAKLKPIHDKGLFAIDGNHGRRIFKETGLSFDETLAVRLGLPYLGQAAFWHLKVHKSLYTIYTHHGVDSGVQISSKVNAAKKLEQIVEADAIISAHSHIALEFPPRYTAYLGMHGIKYRTTHEYIAGSSYDSRTGYAEEKGYPPIIPSYISIQFDGREIEGKPQIDQKFDIWRAKI